MLFEVKEIDKRVYNDQLRDFLPDTIIDIHTHVWLDQHRSGRNDRRRIATWPDRVAKHNPIHELLETYRLMFPGKRVTPLIFPSVLSPKDDIERQNEYVRACAERHHVPALIWSVPQWSASELEKRIVAGRFLGLKSYLSHAPEYIPEPEIRIFDAFPPHHLEVLDRHGWIMMLHIPRPGRLRDPVNLAQMIEIEKRYPNIKLIIAHVGRAYCPENVGNAFEVLAGTRTMRFDISANTCTETFEKLIEAVGPKRILFGSDLPVARMRTRRICEGGQYINLVPKGLYGDVSGDGHLREVGGAETRELTFFMYEELKAFRRAAEITGLSRDDLEDIFCNNARTLIDSVKPKPAQLRMTWPKDRRDSPPTWTLPDGYSLRTYRPGDEAGYIRVMKGAGFGNWGEKRIRDTLTGSVPNGLFFVVHNATGEIVATAVAVHRSHTRGELGWVAADPEHRGRGLGYIVCAAVLKRLLEAGYEEINLLTDDFRLPAIKTYLKLGFEPVFFAPDMAPRWKAVRSQLRI